MRRPLLDKTSAHHPIAFKTESQQTSTLGPAWVVRMQISDARNNGAWHIAGAQGREQQQRRGLKGSAPFPFAGTPCRLAITSWMCPKQDLALRIKTAFSRYEPGVTQASIIERTVPSASLSPFRPCDVVAILAVRISRFPGRTKDALSGAAWTGDYVAGYRRGSCQHRNKNGSNANSLNFVTRSSLCPPYVSHIVLSYAPHGLLPYHLPGASRLIDRGSLTILEDY